MVANLSESKEDFKQVTVSILGPCANLGLVVFHSLKDSLRFSSTFELVPLMGP